jgi:hypothetical protein
MVISLVLLAFAPLPTACIAFVAYVYAEPLRIQYMAGLSTREIIKSRNFDEYLKLEAEYSKIISCLNCHFRNSSTFNDVIHKDLNDLRRSPFFDNSYRPEYENLWLLTMSNKSELECKDIYRVEKNNGYFWNSNVLKKACLDGCKTKHTKQELIHNLYTKIHSFKKPID